MKIISALLLFLGFFASGAEAATKVNLGYCSFDLPSGFSLALYRSTEPLVFTRGSELFGVFRQTNEEFFSREDDEGLFGINKVKVSGELEMYEYAPVGPVGIPGTKVIRVSGQWSIVFGADLEALGESIFEQCLESLLEGGA